MINILSIYNCLTLFHVEHIKYNMDIKSRITEFVKHKNITISKFETSCGITRGYFYNVKSSIGSDKLNDISNTFPELNISWLVTGKGNMLNNEIKQTEDLLPTLSSRENEMSEIILGLSRTIQIQQKQITDLIAEIDRMKRTGDVAQHGGRTA